MFESCLMALLSFFCLSSSQFFVQDGCGTDKLAEGIRAFVGETEKLEKAITDKVREAM